MSLTPADAGNIAAGIAGGGGFAWWVMRQVAAKLVARLEAVETKVQGIELSIAGELPNKDDMSQLLARMERLEATLGEVRDMSRDMAIRFDEREKAARHS